MRRIFTMSLLLITLLPAQPLPAGTLEAASPTESERFMRIDGNWFSCEFAHSQIPPNDGCQMLDDDGFIVSRGKIIHIKVTNSPEINCRHERKGQCFKRDMDRIVVEKDPVGDIRPTAGGFAITYWGCTQEYAMHKRDGYFEVAPSGDRCLWTREKRYFITRYQGRLQTASN